MFRPLFRAFVEARAKNEKIFVLFGGMRRLFAFHIYESYFDEVFKMQKPTINLDF